MADIRAFRGYRYNSARIGSLSDVIAPPYDVIDAALQDALYARSPHNVIRLELSKDEPTDNDNNNRYTRAADQLRALLSDDVLVQDSARSLYVYHQDFEVEGRRFTRKGFMARVRLEPFGTGRIYPHEETLSGPKADRLKLYRATHMNLSPVFGLYPDEQGTVNQVLDAAVERALPLQATDHLGVVSKLWPIHDSQLISTITGLLGPKPVFIADGHHRYETGLRYLEERRELGEVHDDDSPAANILMMLVSMSDPGLIILPTHRLLMGLPPVSSGKLTEILGGHFDITKIGIGDKAAQEARESIEADGSQGLLGFCTVDDNAWILARLKSSQEMAKLAPEHSDDWRELAVAVLHVLVIDRLLTPALGVKPTCKYVHLLDEVRQSVAAKECRVAVLVPAATMGHVEQIAGNLEKMPPKSTYFYPKLLSGLVFNSLKTN
jgi:uncharacterized protein (DUF1015 family)